MPETEKGAVLNARILWTFSAAYRLLKKEEYLSAAMRAKRYVIDHFYDREFGGIYWSLDYKGHPLDTKKQIYAIGFAIYGLSELVSQKNECYNDYREKSDRLHELMTIQRNYQMAMPQPKRGRSHEQER